MKPCVLIRPDGSREVIVDPVPFLGPGDIQHPATAWLVWSPEDWALMAPGCRVLDLVDAPPASVAGKRAVRRPEAEWTEGADGVTVTYQMVELLPAELAAQLDADRSAKVAAINVERERRLALGAPYGAKRIEVSDKGRADLGGMVSAAILATSGAAPWSEGYARGWIAMDNERVPLSTPLDGITLAASVGDWYGLIMQHARDLKDEALASADPAGVDHLAGWPD